MSSNCGRQSAADMREQQKKNLAQATAVQPTVAVMEHNWQALIASLKMVTEIEAQILEQLALLATTEELISLMGKQIEVLEEYQEAAIQAMQDYQKLVSTEAKDAQKLMQAATKAIEARSGEVSEKFSKAICEEQQNMRKWMIRCLLISLIPSVLQVILLLTQLI